MTFWALRIRNEWSVRPFVGVLAYRPVTVLHIADRRRPWSAQVRD
jgi:hypothetical protein